MELIQIVLKSLTKKIKKPRQRKLPKRFDESSSPHYHQSPKEMYPVIYFDVHDNVINGAKERFHQPDSEICKHINNIFIDAINQKCYEDSFSILKKT